MVKQCAVPVRDVDLMSQLGINAPEALAIPGICRTNRRRSGNTAEHMTSVLPACPRSLPSEAGWRNRAMLMPEMSSWVWGRPNSGAHRRCFALSLSPRRKA